MQNNQIVNVTNLGKCYHIYDKPQDRIKQVFSRRKKYYREFWALQDINLTVKRGEAIGIIGRNGSGKSTLLQMLCQTLTPTTGKIEINGRIAALLELGAGFNHEFTGRENVYLNGAILGFSRKEMHARFDEIAAFADIGDFMDQPVKTYSSGMFVRLAFSVQAGVNPDILIVDEALSVGDIFFQQKCAKRMQQLRDQGTTLVFVSHDMAAIRDLCENAIYLRKGQVIFSGDSSEAVRQYFSESHVNTAVPSVTRVKPAASEPNRTITDLLEKFKKTACWLADPADTAPRDAKLLAVTVLNEHEQPTMQTKMGNTLKIQILYQSFTDKPIHPAIAFRNRYDHVINSSGSYTKNIPVPIIKIEQYAIFELEINCMIEAGLYTFSAGLGYIFDVPNRGQVIDTTPWLGPLTITWDYENEKAPWLGMFNIPSQARLIKVHEDE